MINNLVKIVVDNGGSLEPIVVETEKGTGLLNPSIFYHNNVLLVNLRHVQYALFHSEINQLFRGKFGPLSYLHPDTDRTLTTTNYFGKYSGGKFNLKEVDTSKLDVEPIWTFVGLEDARVVVWEDRTFLCGVRRDTTPNGVGRMEMSELVKGKEIGRYRLDTPFSADTYCEKNWMPINSLPYHFVKWSNPVEVVKVDLTEQAENGFYKCDQVYLNKNKIDVPRDLRGGSNVVNWGDGYMFITHEVDLWKNEHDQKDAFYYHRFVYMNRDFEIERWSDAFNFMTGHIEFCCGLAVNKDDVKITFGFQDNAAFMLNTTKETIEKIFNDF
jgi:hypothetical protein